MTVAEIPDRTEAAEYYFKYIDQVPEGPICDVLATQFVNMSNFLKGISDEASLERYAPDKWTIRQVISHVNDAERLFTFRAFWFARGFDSPLPSFDQEIAAAAACADSRPWNSHVNEFRAVRTSTLAFFRGLPLEAWSRRGTASGNPFSVRAIGYIVAGHTVHHRALLQERYLGRH